MQQLTGFGMRGRAVGAAVPFALLLAVISCQGPEAGGAPAASGPAVTATAALPPLRLSALGQPGLEGAALDSARRNGLELDDAPSIGSGLVSLGGGEFYGLTDRGPNEERVTAEGGTDGMFFPLPRFAPTIVRFRVDGARLVPDRFLPLSGVGGAPVSGLPNNAEDGRAFTTASGGSPLPFDPSGLDPEALQRFPDGRFLIAEEYGPSLLVTDASGRILVRYMPAGKPLPGAVYPVTGLLPARYAQRRLNRGFESVALSPDGKTAFAILQSPMGEVADERYAESRVLRALKLDLSDPLKAKVIAEHLVIIGDLADYPGTKRQQDMKVSDAAWVAPDRLLLLERGKGLVRLVLADFRNATNVLDCRDAASLIYERSGTDLAAQGVRPAVRSDVLVGSAVPALDEDKLEGVAILSATEVALISDNDFGMGDNETGAPCKFWTVRLPAPLPRR